MSLIGALIDIVGSNGVGYQVWTNEVPGNRRKRTGRPQSHGLLRSHGVTDASPTAGFEAGAHTTSNPPPSMPSLRGTQITSVEKGSVLKRACG